MVKRDTIQRVATPTAIIVGLGEPLASVCGDALQAGGLRVLRVGHVAAACERIPVVMPQIVVVSTTLRPDDTDMLTDRCVAVGADIVKVAPDSAADGAVRATLREAANIALVRSLRSGN